jgi:hypothetical protein
MEKQKNKNSIIELERDNPNGWERCTSNDLRNFKEKEFRNNYVGSGVYIIKVINPVKHFKGSSKIIYIGSSKNLMERLRLLFRFIWFNGDDQTVHTAKKSLRRIVNEAGIQIEVLFKIFNSNHTVIESELIQEFMEIHIEKPPVNCNRK